jgi:CTP synthase
VLFVHLTYIPYLAHSDEIKTKPTQHSVKELMSIGIVPDILLCRSSVTMGNNNKRKIAEFCNVDEDGVIEAIDLPSIYSVPLHYVGQNIHKVMMRKFEITKYAEPQLDYLKKLILNQEKSQKRVNIAIVGKYTSYRDSYKSIIESILHASLSMEVGYEITWIEARELDVTKLNNISGVIVPGGFGKDGIDGKIEALKYCRENNIPTLGICLGMQMMVVEFARNVLKMDTGSEEFTPENTNNVVKLIKNFINKGDKVEYRDTDSDLGGTMRLGSYKAKLSEGSQIRQIYGSDIISERHRHRYEVDCTTEYDRFFESGMRFSGSSVYSGDLKVVLTECIEVVNHPFYIGVQFHPEFKSKLFEPHPLFCAFVETCLKKS